jgi:hypothetical protein
LKNKNLTLAECKCIVAAAKKDLYHDLVKEKTLEVISSVNEDYEEKTKLKCLVCNTKWVFSKEDSYHYPIISWRKI